MKVNVTWWNCPISYGKTNATQHHALMRYIRISQEGCMLCLTGEDHIIFFQQSLLNLRNELIAKCRHEKKFYLINCKGNAA